MSRHFTGPRAGSTAYKGLVKLHQAGGCVTIYGWMSALHWESEIKAFERAYVEPLVRQQMVSKLDDKFQITEDGLDLLGVPFDAPAMVQPVVAGPRYLPPMQPLSASNMPRLRATREGAFDYRDIPSRHGQERVAFQSSLKVEDASE